MRRGLTKRYGHENKEYEEAFLRIWMTRQVHDRYWAFSWQEMALYDMSAIINYVLTTTGHSTLCYVGNSEGTMQAFAGFSVDQELARKVSYFGALAPVAYLGHITSSIF
ncbi:hypothetical protein PF001_g3071 [Phytophthora fragariae]|uniref:Uncharacterized protein n=1 Tax=Phytophthora fragariae TaxID=53985 RepID=A0A6A3FRS3_9STRA|nr:hypothetical protein PF009_g3234 [Phytophthora fragariae]KAE9325200.1 hypothetical protein PF001_g3071 [Phytophthora fragariae]